MTFKLLLDHADFVAVEKPIGFNVHQEGEAEGFVTLLEVQLGYKLWLVHRLDKVTSGILLLAKNAEAAALLGAEFAGHRITKLYLALSDQKPKRKQGRIQGDMQPARGGSFKLTKTRNSPAITDFFSLSLTPGVRLFVCRPKTGKTHQIRVALKSEGAAISGDDRYGTSSSDRTYLHAWYLRFSYQGREFTIESKPNEGALFLGSEFAELYKRIHEESLFPSHWDFVF